MHKLNISYMIGSAYKLPQEIIYQEFDVVIMEDVLEHLHDLPKAISDQIF